jgi:hypothetical protein
LIEGIADAFALFISRCGRFFRSKTRDSAAVAGRYLRGLAQAQDWTFAAMASVVDDSCAQQFQHCISNSPWDNKPVLAQIGRDADRLLGGKPSSCLIIDESSFAKPSGLTRGRAIVRWVWHGSGWGGWVRSTTARWRCLACCPMDSAMLPLTCGSIC